ncbi:MAG TPA: hypothetical protein VEI07_18995 [Planctomycetaceae bacterium]|nr:hypothetical protein [Planctomycetaceae bacterium]
MPPHPQHQDVILELGRSIDRLALPQPPVELQQLAKEESWHQQGGLERRRYRRYSLITNVIVLPLDTKLRPLGQPFVALSSGMSVGGIRLLHTQPPQSDNLFIEIEQQPVRFLVSLLRSRPLDDCFEFAGQFIETIASQASGSANVVSARCPAVSRAAADFDAVENDAMPGVGPTAADLEHWAGLSAAVSLLTPASGQRV